MQQVVIMRGVPGSGKSTMAAKILEHSIKTYGSAIVCSNDDYPGYYPEGVYAWTRERAKEARKWCQEKFEQAIKDGVAVVIVDNCHLTEKSYSFYKQAAEAAGYEVSFNVFQPEARLEYAKACAARNKHGVDLGMIINMMKSWEY